MVNFAMRAVEVVSEGSGEGGDHWSGDGSVSFIAAGLYQHPSVAATQTSTTPTKIVPARRGLRETTLNRPPHCCRGTAGATAWHRRVGRRRGRSARNHSPPNVTVDGAAAI